MGCYTWQIAARRSANAKGSDKHAKDADGKKKGFNSRKAVEKAASVG